MRIKYTSFVLMMVMLGATLLVNAADKRSAGVKGDWSVELPG